MKTLFFLPVILFFAFFGLLVIGFFVLIFKLVAKQKNTAWIGKIVDKSCKQGRDIDTDEVGDYYTVVIETETGNKITRTVTKQVYDEYKIGDRIEKKKGEINPKKI